MFKMYSHLLTSFSRLSSMSAGNFLLSISLHKKKHREKKKKKHREIPKRFAFVIVDPTKQGVLSVTLTHKGCFIDVLKKTRFWFILAYFLSEGSKLINTHMTTCYFK